jgi:hypothetical protein
MVITSHINGRIRVRDSRLRRAPVLERVREALLLRSDVSEVSSNPKTGSLLILYRKGCHVLAELTGLLQELLGPGLPAPVSAVPEKSPVSPPPNRLVVSRRRVVNLGMLAGLLLTLLTMAVNKELHILAGLHFLGFLAIHLFDKRRTLFT